MDTQKPYPSAELNNSVGIFNSEKVPAKLGKEEKCQPLKNVALNVVLPRLRKTKTKNSAAATAEKSSIS